MKILIDIDDLLKNGTITEDIAALLRSHSAKETGSTAINVLLAFGAIAIASGFLSLMPSSGFAAFFGAGFIALGWLIKQKNYTQWGKLASIWMITGALVLSGAVGVITDQPLIAPIIAAIVLAFVSFLAESKLLISLVPLAIAAAIGGSTGYWHACYSITITEPTLSIILFAALAYGAWNFAKTQTGTINSLSVVFSRMCVVLVNFGFWVGSLWGDTIGNTWQSPESTNFFNESSQQIPPAFFIISWAVAIFMAGAWGAKNNRRFMVNTAAVFGAIHFYTQWFEIIGFYPVSVIIAGIATIAIGLSLWRYNRKVL